MSRAPIAVALDAPDLETTRSWAFAVAPHVQCLKVGLEVFCREGPAVVQLARSAAAEAGQPDIDLFVDLKLHDIPATVHKAAGALKGLRPVYVTVHAAGGPEMIRAAATALPDTRITAVTVLTSLDSQTLVELGLAGSPLDVVVRWSQMAVAAGARALVCSPHEVAAVRDVVGNDITLITPGVRPVGADSDDQRRVATPEQALADGADLLVIGRPITGKPDPASAAAALAESLFLGRA